MSKTVLVTGGNQGIGYAIAERFAAEGFPTILSGRRTEAVDEAAKVLASKGLDVTPLTLDTGDLSSIEEAVDELAKKDIDVSILINNAAILAKGTLMDMSDDDLVASLDINVLGPIRLIRALAPQMTKNGYGRIVNVSSDWGSFAGGIGGPGAYGFTKTALNASTVRFAKDLPDTIKINAMHPGWVKTQMGGQEAPVLPVNAAETAYWLGTLPDNGPTGGFFFEKRQFEW